MQTNFGLSTGLCTVCEDCQVGVDTDVAQETEGLRLALLFG